MEPLIDHNLFNEIGIDSKERIKRFKKIKNKHNSLNPRIKKDKKFFDYLSKRFGKRKEESEKDFIKRLSNQEGTSNIIDLILVTKNKLDGEIAREVFKKERYYEDSLSIIAFDAYENKDLLRKIHYTSFLKTQRHLVLNSNQKLELDLDDCKEEEIQELLKKHPKIKQKNIINIWYVLKNEEGVAFFIYAEAKNKKVLPSPKKKFNHFVNYSKPNVIFFRNKGNELLVYSRDIERNIKYASAIACKKDKNLGEFKKVYEVSEYPSNKTDIDKFLDDLLEDKIEEIKLLDISFTPQSSKYDSSVTIKKNKDGLNLIFSDLEKTWGNSFINSQKVEDIKLLFGSIQINLIFIQVKHNKSEIYIRYNYSSRDPSVGKNIKEILNKKYNLKLNKPGR